MIPAEAPPGEPRESRDSIHDVWGPRTPYEGTWPVRVDDRSLAEPDRWVDSVCVLCSLGCGVEVGAADDRIVAIRGRADDRVNHGRLGPKGLHAWEANASPDRLTAPIVRKGGRLVSASWDEAMTLIVDRSRMFEDLKHVKAWIDLDGSHELGPGPRQSPENQEEAYPLSRCMTCGCCLEACPQYATSPGFIGPAAINQVRLFNLHPSGQMHASERLETVMGEGGVQDS